MKKLVFDLVVTVAIVLICVFVFGENLGDVLIEAAWLYGVIAVVGILLCIYIGWALTRAMNPKLPKKDNDADQH